MAQPATKKWRYGRYAKGIIILLVVVAVASWGYYSYTNPTRPSSVTFATTTHPSTTTNLHLQQGDFNITNDSGCVHKDASTGKDIAVFYLTITNRFNATVHYINASLAATVLLNNGTKINIPEKQVPGSPTFSNAVTFPIYVGIAGAGFEKGTATSVSLIITAYIQEINKPIELPLFIPIPSMMQNC